MANNYTLFSAQVEDLEEEHREWFERMVQCIEDSDVEPNNEEEIIQWCRERGMSDDYDYEAECWPPFDWQFENDGKTFVMYSSEVGSPEAVALLVRQYILKFRPEMCWAMTYAETCSKPRIDEFSGGMIFVSANDYEHENTWAMAEKRKSEFLESEKL